MLFIKVYIFSYNNIYKLSKYNKIMHKGNKVDRRCDFCGKVDIKEEILKKFIGFCSNDCLEKFKKC